MNGIPLNLNYLDEPSRKPVLTTAAAMPRVGDYFQIPYGKGKRYRVAAIVFESDREGSAIVVELVTAA